MGLLSLNPFSFGGQDLVEWVDEKLILNHRIPFTTFRRMGDDLCLQSK